ncbi:NfeD family protein, partial [Sphingomonas bacterium]|uniref:NfeD family protein n=1 Tax=Sphingomonas bacterium TaxID=1895847 RepID=UPI0015767D31
MSAGTAWLAIALMLGVAEVAAPGVFLIFIALSAAMTGLTVLAAPALPLGFQLMSVGLWSAMTLWIGRRWYRDYPVAGERQLNRGAARLVGEVVTVERAIEGGSGRVSVGDGAWPASGP